MNKKQKLAVLNIFNKALLEDKKYDEYYINELLKFGVICSQHSDFEIVYQYIKEKLSGSDRVEDSNNLPFEIAPFIIDGKMAGSFTDEWSVSAFISENQQKPTREFLTYLLGYLAQEEMHFKRDNAVPLNKIAFDNFVKINEDFGFLDENDNLSKLNLSGQYKNLLADFNGRVFDLIKTGGDMDSLMN